MKKGDRRETIRKRLNDLYVPFYDALCKEMPEEWQPYSGLRTFEQQDALYAKGRTASGAIVTSATAGNSPHNYGCATDWTIFNLSDEPIWIKKDDPRWQVYEIACARVNLNWGGLFPTMADCYHNEYPLKCSWRLVKTEYDKGGMEAAVKFIEANHWG